ncbi:GIY-YIG nuclease family protein [Metabacillus sediminilitoris]|uniref:Uncharacterized protein n=1 Tax=Metabacillus sediminilitoris TaxID=2567941 RepID=A0A4S4BUX7_9BACI|nr:GIY-YIG nuclease family protein [Metabacillus sediminilitoris]QGQ44746.1 hypothetical protein GMB29_05355 [Metabacillus sediminilitoris]THF78906.1 hypothetical protein E6W99_14365 [Metabacillus sediminilitoris]
MGKQYTHAKGFNVTSLEGVAGVYILQETCGDVAYIGHCNNDFKNRIRSHTNKTNGKLDNNIQYLHVVIIDPDIYPLHVLEHLFIWYFNPPRNEDLWIFSRNKTVRQVKETAKKHNINIQGTLEEFLLSFETVFIEREWDDNFELKRYGEVETQSSKKSSCDGTLNCLCYQCLIDSRSKVIW